MATYRATNPFEPFLFTGERILWTGQPKQGLQLSGKDVFLIPFSLMWGGFALFWNIGVWGLPFGGEAAPLFFRLWGLPFLLAGAYLIIGRFFHDAAVRKRTYYAVSDQRILIRRGLSSAKLVSLDIHRLPMLELSEHRDASGTIAFDTAGYAFCGGYNGFAWWAPSLDRTPQFIRIANPRPVYELIRKQAYH